nr:hypothetical protein [Tanacetum cinerariifolium]
MRSLYGVELDISNISTTYPVPTTLNTRINKDQSLDNVIGDMQSGLQTRRMTVTTDKQEFISAIYEEKTHEDLHTCLFAYFLSQEEPKRITNALKDLAWVYRNKKDERGIVIRNKARLVAQGYTQEEGIDYDEVFAPIERIKAIRLFLAYASYMGFLIYQMDVKSAFLYGRGKIDQTLFIKRQKEDILLVQVYVDDIIFGSTKKELCTEFEELMHHKFQMSSMEELTFFLGLEVKQKGDGIFIIQDKYVAEILKKFDFISVKTVSTPIETQKPLTKDKEAADVDVHLYRSMIGSLMYLIASRPDIIFAVYACSRVSSFDLEAYSDSDYVGANLDRKSTTGCCQFFNRRLISWQCQKQTIMATSTIEAEYVAATNCCGQVLWIQNQITIHHALTVSPTIYTSNIEQFWNTASSQTINDEKQNHATVDSKAVVVTEASIRSSLLFNDADGTACLTNEAIFQNLALMGYEEVWLKSVQRLSMKKRFGKKECVSKQGRKKDKHELTLDDRIFDGLDADLDVDHGMDYIDTEEPVNEGRLSEETEELKLTIDTEEISHDKSSGEKGRSTEKLVSTARPEDSTVSLDVGTADPIASPTTTTSIFYDEDITMAQTLIKMKEEKAKEKGVSIKDIEDSSRPARSILTLKPLPTTNPKDKGKGILEEPEPAKKMTRSDLDAAQIAKDVEVARLVYEEELAELEREKEKRQREEEASKAVIAEMYDEVQAGIKVDALFAANLQREEREEYTIKERAKFLAETIVAKRIFRAEQRSAEIRSRPPTKSHLRNLMMTYLKNMDDAVDKEKVLEEPDNTKVKVKQERDEESIRKRPWRRLKMKATKKSKRKKTNFNLKEEEHIKTFLQIVPDEEGEVDYEVLDKRIPIINYSRWIKTFSEVVTRFDRMDLEELYNLVIVHTLTFEDGTEIYMLAERRYPLTKETLERMLALRLIAESENEAVFYLLRFIQKQIDESGSHDGSEKDL